MNKFSVSRLALALAIGVTLSACSSTPPEQQPSTQMAPGNPARPVLSAQEAGYFLPQHYFADMNPNAAPWTPYAISVPAQPDFVVGPAGTQGVTHTSIQAAVNAAIAKHSSKRQYIAVLPGEYTGAVYIPTAPGSVTIYGATDDASAVKIDLGVEAEMDRITWRKTVNPSGRFMPGMPSWYMFDNCQNQRGATAGMMCAAVMWSQNNGLQLKNLTIENSLLDNVDGSDHNAIALRSDGDKVQLDNVRLVGRQNTFFVTNSDAQNRLLNNRQTRTEVKNSYIEGDVDMVIGRGAVVFDNTEFHVVSSRHPQQLSVFAPNTLPGIYYGFLVTNSRLTGDNADGASQLGRSWDSEATQNSYTPGHTSNGQIVIRDSIIDGSFNNTAPWGAALNSSRAFSGNIAADRNLNDANVNRLWEYNNRGAGSLVAPVTPEAK